MVLQGIVNIDKRAACYVKRTHLYLIIIYIIFLDNII